MAKNQAKWPKIDLFFSFCQKFQWVSKCLKIKVYPKHKEILRKLNTTEVFGSTQKVGEKTWTIETKVIEGRREKDAGCS